MEIIRTNIGSVDLELLEVFEYFENEPLVIQLVKDEIRNLSYLHLSIALYSEDSVFKLEVRESNLALGLLTLHRKVREHKEQQNKPTENNEESKTNV